MMNRARWMYILLNVLFHEWIVYGLTVDWTLSGVNDLEQKEITVCVGDTLNFTCPSSNSNVVQVVNQEAFDNCTGPPPVLGCDTIDDSNEIGSCALKGLVTVPVKITAALLPCVPRFNPGTVGLFISSTDNECQDGLGISVNVKDSTDPYCMSSFTSSSTPTLSLSTSSSTSSTSTSQNTNGGNHPSSTTPSTIPNSNSITVTGTITSTSGSTTSSIQRSPTPEVGGVSSGAFFFDWSIGLQIALVVGCLVGLIILIICPLILFVGIGVYCRKSHSANLKVDAEKNEEVTGLFQQQISSDSDIDGNGKRSPPNSNIKKTEIELNPIINPSARSKNGVINEKSTKPGTSSNGVYTSESSGNTRPAPPPPTSMSSVKNPRVKNSGPVGGTALHSLPNTVSQYKSDGPSTSNVKNTTAKVSLMAPKTSTTDTALQSLPNPVSQNKTDKINLQSVGGARRPPPSIPTKDNKTGQTGNISSPRRPAPQAPKDVSQSSTNKTKTTNNIKNPMKSV